MIRIGFWGPLYYNYSKEPKIELVLIKAPTLFRRVPYFWGI